MTRAASARLRRVSSHSGKYVPERSFGTCRSIVPARVSHGRGRYPLREFTRSGLRAPNSAPQIASACAPISASANTCTIERSRSGLACSNCSWIQPDMSIFVSAVIALLL